MTRTNRITLLIVSSIMFLIVAYGPAMFMEVAGKLFLYAIAACLTFIAIRRE